MVTLMSDGKVLVVDDDPSLSEMLQIVLTQEGFETTWCGRGDEAVAAFRREKPDLVLLDLMLPGRSGIDICRTIRAESTVAIVMLTAKSDTADVVLGLEAGADDYIAKPFAPRELIARVRTRLRHLPSPDVEVLHMRDITISVESHQVHKAGQLIAVTPVEFDLLLVMARHPQHVLSREFLLRQVWGYRNPTDTRLVNVHIQRLRGKVERDPDNPEIIQTVRGVGYRVSA
ncbi:MAG: response regulator transcription factor [Propionibacteriaceae bacterium]|jgi:two-component system response regulator MtrA|nr:response regulator transcription factor [Propionibacteriaceae bacterium]